MTCCHFKKKASLLSAIISFYISLTQNAADARHPTQAADQKLHMPRQKLRQLVLAERLRSTKSNLRSQRSKHACGNSSCRFIFPQSLSPFTPTCTSIEAEKAKNNNNKKNTPVSYFYRPLSLSLEWQITKFSFSRIWLNTRVASA